MEVEDCNFRGGEVRVGRWDHTAGGARRWQVGGLEGAQVGKRACKCSWVARNMAVGDGDSPIVIVVKSRGEVTASPRLANGDRNPRIPAQASVPQ